MFSVEDAGRTYGQTVALHPTSLEIPAGETTVLIGQSGSGKSTLLRLLVGLIRPTQGRVLFEGTEITPANVREVRHRMGYVIQDGGLFPHLTASQNVLLLARELGKDETQMQQRVKELAELTEFPLDGLDRYPVQLSGGQRQRVALMRALVLDPDVLLLDEPLGALDPIIRADLQEDLRNIFANLRKTVVVVTHDLGEARYLGHQIVLMRDGAIVQKGVYEDLINNPADDYVDRFLTAQRSAAEV